MLYRLKAILICWPVAWLFILASAAGAAMGQEPDPIFEWIGNLSLTLGVVFASYFLYYPFKRYDE